MHDNWALILYDFTNIYHLFSIAEPRVLAPRRKRIGQLHPLFQFSNNVSSTQQQVSSIQAKQPPNGQHWAGKRAAEAAAAAAGRKNPYASTHTDTHARRTKGIRHISGPPHRGSYLSTVVFNARIHVLEARVCVCVCVCVVVCDGCACVYFAKVHHNWLSICAYIYNYYLRWFYHLRNLWKMRGQPGNLRCSRRHKGKKSFFSIYLRQDKKTSLNRIEKKKLKWKQKKKIYKI